MCSTSRALGGVLRSDTSKQIRTAKRTIQNGRAAIKTVVKWALVQGVLSLAIGGIVWSNTRSLGSTSCAVALSLVFDYYAYLCTME